LRRKKEEWEGEKEKEKKGEERKGNNERKERKKREGIEGRERRHTGVALALVPDPKRTRKGRRREGGKKRMSG
jgi:hypothetical protein